MRRERLIVKQFFVFSICILLILIPVLAGCGRREIPIQSATEVPLPPQLPTPIPDIPSSLVGKEGAIDATSEKSMDEVVQDVINGVYGTGEERIERLSAEGYDAAAIQAEVDTLVDNNVEKAAVEEPVTTFTSDPYIYPPDTALNPWVGVVYYNGHRETYYSQQVLPGGGLNIPGRYVAEDGTIRDENGYICVAADPSYLSYGSLVETSLGTGKVYDSGCDYGTIDIYTNW